MHTRDYAWYKKSVRDDMVYAMDTHHHTPMQARGFAEYQLEGILEDYPKERPLAILALMRVLSDYESLDAKTFPSVWLEEARFAFSLDAVQKIQMDLSGLAASGFWEDLEFMRNLLKF